MAVMTFLVLADRAICGNVEGDEGASKDSCNRSTATAYGDERPSQNIEALRIHGTIPLIAHRMLPYRHISRNERERRVWLRRTVTRA
jgi:hypothetical protein